MDEFLLIPSDSGRNVNTSQNSIPSIHSRHSLAGLLKRARSQQFVPQASNVAEHVSSLTARISNSLRTRLSQSLKERRLIQERHERRQILELRMSNVSRYRCCGVLCLPKIMPNLPYRPLATKNGKQQLNCSTNSMTQKAGRRAVTATNFTVRN